MVDSSINLVELLSVDVVWFLKCVLLGVTSVASLVGDAAVQPCKSIMENRESNRIASLCMLLVFSSWFLVVIFLGTNLDAFI